MAGRLGLMAGRVPPREAAVRLAAHHQVAEAAFGPLANRLAVARSPRDDDPARCPDMTVLALGGPSPPVRSLHFHPTD